MDNVKYTVTTASELGAQCAKVMPPPFEIETASLSDLIAVIQWCKWEIKALKVDNISETEFIHNEIGKTESFMGDVEDEVAKRILPVLNQYEPI